MSDRGGHANEHIGWLHACGGQDSVFQIGLGFNPATFAQVEGDDSSFNEGGGYQ